MYTPEQLAALLSDNCLCKTDLQEDTFRYLVLNSLINIVNAIGDIPGGGGGALPPGASTSALQVELNGLVDNVEALLAVLNTSLTTIDGKITVVNTDAVTVTSLPAITGTVGISGALPLPTGASTSALQTTGNTALTSIDGKIVTVNTDNVNISSSALPVGASTSALQNSGNALLTAIDGKIVLVDTSNVIITGSVLPTGAATSALQGTANTALTSIDGKIVAVNTGAVTIVAQPTSSTATETTVPGSASSVTILAANALRKGAFIYNDSTAILYLRLSSSAASTSVFTVKLFPEAYYELPGTYLYIGAITGIWASATGNARVTELT